MRLLCALSTRGATRFALRLFFQPIPFPIPEREKPFRTESITHELQTAEGKPFKVFELGEGRQTLILIHGWSGRGSQFFKIAEDLKKQYRLLAIDAPGHGDHRGKRSHMLEFVDAIETTQQKLGPVYGAIGHSLGGLALFNAMERGIHFQQLAIIGTPSTIPNVIGDFCAQVKANAKVAKGIIQYLEKRYQLSVDEVSTVSLAQKYNPKGLILHDKDDRDVPVKNASESAAAWSHAKLHLTKGLGHRRILMDPKVLKLLYDFFKN